MCNLLIEYLRSDSITIACDLIGVTAIERVLPFCWRRHHSKPMARITATTASVAAIVPTTMAATLGRDGQSSSVVVCAVAVVSIDVNTASVDNPANDIVILISSDVIPSRIP